MDPDTTPDHVIVPVSPDRVRLDEAAGRERLLRYSRRLDWRFLLPDPHLGRVALLGEADPILVEALREFSDSFFRLERGTEWIGDRENGCDVVVVRSLQREALATASRLLREGGFLYWEIGPDRPGRFPSSAEFRSLLQELGFRGVRPHWHRPSFRACLEIVPLRDEEMISYVLGRRAGSWRGAARLAVGRSLRRLGLLRLLVPCWSVVACLDTGRQADE
jgi:hypothetical protein